MSHRRRRDETGSAIVEFVWLAILLLVPLLWIVVSVFQVQGGAFAVSAGARSAGRAFALAPNDAAGRVAAQAAARQSLDDQGMNGESFTVRITCTPYPANCHSGTSIITVVLSSRRTLPLLPSFFGGGRPSFALEASHTVPIGRYQEILDAP